MIYDWLERALEEIDAGVFSGDVLEHEEMKIKLKEYVERWNRALNNKKDLIDKLNKHDTRCGIHIANACDCGWGY